MTWKSILGITAIAAVSASQATAQAPSLRVADGGVGSSGRLFDVFITPGVDGNAVALELGFDLSSVDNGSGEIDSQTSIIAYTLNDDVEGTGVAGDGPFGELIEGEFIQNPGNNPFTLSETNTVFGTPLLDADQLFAAEGSGPLTGETLAFSFEIADPIAVGTIVGNLIAENGDSFEIVSSATSDPTEIVAEIRFGVDGDFDFGGQVDQDDFLTLAGNFGAPGVTPETPGNFDGDNDVDGQDFLTLAGNFGLDVADNGAGPVIATPEPASVTGLAICCLVVSCCHRRRYR